MLDHPVDLLEPGRPANARLVGVLAPGLHSRRDGDAMGVAQPHHPVAPQNRERGLHYVSMLGFLRPGGRLSITSRTWSNFTAKLGSWYPSMTPGRCAEAYLRSAASLSVGSSRYGLSQSMQKLQAYGQPMLASTGIVVRRKGCLC